MPRTTTNTRGQKLPELPTAGPYRPRPKVPSTPPPQYGAPPRPFDTSPYRPDPPIGPLVQSGQQRFTTPALRPDPNAWAKQRASAGSFRPGATATPAPAAGWGGYGQYNPANFTTPAPATMNIGYRPTNIALRPDPNAWARQQATAGSFQPGANPNYTMPAPAQQNPYPWGLSGNVGITPAQASQSTYEQQMARQNQWGQQMGQQDQYQNLLRQLLEMMLRQQQGQSYGY